MKELKGKNQKAKGKNPAREILPGAKPDFNGVDAAPWPAYEIADIGGFQVAMAKLHHAGVKCKDDTLPLEQHYNNQIAYVALDISLTQRVFWFLQDGESVTMLGYEVKPLSELFIKLA